MKKRIVLKSVLGLIALFISVSLNAQSEKLTIDTSKSEIKWTGEYAFYFGGHEGTIDFKEGYFIKTGELITGGEFIIDMTTIRSTDIDDPKGRRSLDEHLKNEDFFEVNVFSEAKLVINYIEYESPERIAVNAELRIKDITKEVFFRGDLNFEKKQMKTKFKIDRTLWGVTFNSKEVEGKLKDGLISDAIGFEVLLAL